jgi:hypothetical protein
LSGFSELKDMFEAILREHDDYYWDGPDGKIAKCMKCDALITDPADVNADARDAYVGLASHRASLIVASLEAETTEEVFAPAGSHVQTRRCTDWEREQ